MCKTVVVNLKHEAFDVYIGRAGRGKEGPFGNPYLVKELGRDWSVKEFELYFLDRIAKDPAFKARVLELKGKRLGCFCKPLACHGDVIAAWLDGDDRKWGIEGGWADV